VVAGAMEACDRPPEEEDVPERARADEQDVQG
jgi:hypothetical protein